MHYMCPYNNVAVLHAACHRKARLWPVDIVPELVGVMHNHSKLEAKNISAQHSKDCATRKGY